MQKRSQKRQGSLSSHSLKIVAVTGGVSSGKTTVCRILNQLGAKVISADELVHKLLTPQNPVGQQVIALLGREIVEEEQLDRSKIAKKVFGNPPLLMALEKILHPAVRAKLAEEIQKEKSCGEVPLLVVEIPLLFEGGFASGYDAIVTVVADEEVSQARYTASTGYPPEEYKQRMARQMDPFEKALKADYVITNNGSLQELYEATAKLYNQLTT